MHKSSYVRWPLLPSRYMPCETLKDRRRHMGDSRQTSTRGRRMGNPAVDRDRPLVGRKALVTFAEIVVITTQRQKLVKRRENSVITVKSGIIFNQCVDQRNPWNQCTKFLKGYSSLTWLLPKSVDFFQGVYALTCLSFAVSCYQKHQIARK